MKRRVAVTGLGVVSPVGNDVASFWTALKEGHSGAGPITRFDASRTDAKIAAEVKGFDPSLYMDKKDARKMADFTQFAVAASVQAWRDAGLGDGYNTDGALRQEHILSGASGHPHGNRDRRNRSDDGVPQENAGVRPGSHAPHDRSPHDLQRRHREHSDAPRPPRPGLYRGDGLHLGDRRDRPSPRPHPLGPLRRGRGGRSRGRDHRVRHRRLLPAPGPEHGLQRQAPARVPALRQGPRRIPDGRGRRGPHPRGLGQGHGARREDLRRARRLRRHLRRLPPDLARSRGIGRGAGHRPGPRGRGNGARGHRLLQRARHLDPGERSHRDSHGQEGLRRRTPSASPSPRRRA